jgi:hypothetical protein
VLLGVLIAFLIAGAMFAVISWAPWIAEDLGRHKRLAQAVIMTAGFFGGCVYTFWPWRRRSAFAFWASICIFFLLHVLGIFFYSTHVRPILLWQWMILGPLEAYAAAFFVGWSTWRFRHFNGHEHPREGPD